MKAVQRLRRLIRLRRLWHHIGVYLQQPEIQSLFLGIERVRGRIARARPAAQALQTRVQRAASKAAARARLP